jgi:hypothetical protein
MRDRSLGMGRAHLNLEFLMYANTRISLGVAFLKRAISETTSAKCIIHAEYVIKTKQYLLTRVTFTHSRSTPLNVKNSETVCNNISDVLQRLSKAVAKKVEEGFVFDCEGMEILNEADETWGDFEMASEMTTSIPGEKPLKEQNEMSVTSRSRSRKPASSALETLTEHRRSCKVSKHSLTLKQPSAKVRHHH